MTDRLREIEKWHDQREYWIPNGTDGQAIDSHVRWLIAEVRRLQALVAPLRDIATQVATQDNLATEGPIYLVQQRRRIYGMDPDYSDNMVWIDEENNEITAKEARAAGDAATHTAYLDIWETVQPFFTMAGAKAYIEANRHRMTDPRVYVDGSYRNVEWKAMRALLLALAHELADVDKGGSK